MMKKEQEKGCGGLQYSSEHFTQAYCSPGWFYNGHEQSFIRWFVLSTSPKHYHTSPNHCHTSFLPKTKYKCILIYLPVHQVIFLWKIALCDNKTSDPLLQENSAPLINVSRQNEPAVETLTMKPFPPFLVVLLKRQPVAVRLF